MTFDQHDAAVWLMSINQMTWVTRPQCQRSGTDRARSATLHGAKLRCPGCGHSYPYQKSYEVRSWVGWHHHVTLSLVARWFLCRERWRVGGKTAAIAMPQMRQVFTRLLRHPAPTP